MYWLIAGRCASSLVVLQKTEAVHGPGFESGIFHSKDRQGQLVCTVYCLWGVKPTDKKKQKQKTYSTEYLNMATMCETRTLAWWPMLPDRLRCSTASNYTQIVQLNYCRGAAVGRIPLTRIACK